MNDGNNKLHQDDCFPVLEAAPLHASIRREAEHEQLGERGIKYDLKGLLNNINYSTCFIISYDVFST